MNKEQIDAVRALELLSNICEKHNIEYFLLAGSCLGGVRHRGMIPWDDDIDVGIPNEQYEKFKYVITEELQGPYVWRNECADYPRFFGKIVKDHKACVDVFRLVKFPDNAVLQKAIWVVRKLMFRAINIKYYQKEHRISKHYLTNPVTTLLSKVLTYAQINSFMRRVEVFSEKHAGKNRINLYSVYSMEKEMIPQKQLDIPSRIVFEGKEYPTVNDPHTYLSGLYGDYMTPPPENERNTERHPERFL